MDRSLWTIYATHMFLEIFLLIQVALIPVYVNEFHLGILEASLVAVVPSLVSLLMNIPAGFITDRFNARHILFASLVIEGISAIVVSLTSDFWTLVIGVSFMRVSSPIYHIPGLSQVSKLVKAEHMNRSIGLHNAMGNLGQAIGVISLTAFLTTLGWRWTYLFWALPILAWSVIVLRCLKTESKPTVENRLSKPSGIRGILSVLSVSFLIFLVAIGVREIGITGTSTFMTTYFVSRSFSDVTASLVFGLGSFMGIIGSLGGGYVGMRIGAKKTLNLVTLASMIFLSLLALASQFSLIIIAFMVYTFFSNSMWVPMNTMVVEMTSASDRGMGFSFYFFLEAIVSTVAPIIAGGIIVLTSVWYVLPTSVVFLATSLLILQLSRKPKPSVS
jgi:MFS family permease